MYRALSLSTLLFAIWLIWSGHYTPLLISFGVLSCALVMLVSHRMNIIDPEGHPIHLVKGSLSYGIWLTWALVQSNIDLVKRVLSPSLPIAPPPSPIGVSRFGPWERSTPRSCIKSARAEVNASTSPCSRC